MGDSSGAARPFDRRRKQVEESSLSELRRWEIRAEDGSATVAAAAILIGAGWGLFGWFPYSQAAMLVGCAALLLMRRRIISKLRPMAFAVGPISISLIVFHSFLYPGAPYDTPLIGSIAIKLDGLRFALEQSLRIWAFALVGLAAIDRVPATAWAMAFGTGGSGRRLGLMLVSSLVLARDLRRRINTIALAQRSRGYYPSGLVGRAVGLTALAGPLAISMLIEAEQRAVTLVVKGFLDEPEEVQFRSNLPRLLLVPASILGLAGVAIRLAL